MQSNNNNNESWKQRLNDLENMPVSFNSEAAWEKLQLRREKPVQKKRTLPYWMAAAAVLVLICMIAFLWKTNTKDTVTPLDGFVAKPIQSTTTEQLPVVIKTEQAPVETLQHVESIKENKQFVNKQPVQRTTVSPENIVAAEANLLVPVITDTIAIATQPVKTASKKLKVVHLNEISSSPETNTGIAQQEGRPYFPVSYQSKKIYTNSTEQNVKKEKNNLVRIKLFP